jgi:hypothetical protein
VFESWIKTLTKKSSCIKMLYNVYFVYNIMSVEAPPKVVQELNQKPTLNKIIYDLFVSTQDEMNNDTRKRLKFLIASGVLNEDLDGERNVARVIEKYNLTEDEYSFILTIVDVAKNHKVELTTKPKIEISKESIDTAVIPKVEIQNDLTQDEIIDVRQPFEDTIGQAADSIGFGKLQEIFGSLRNTLNLLDPEQTPVVKYQDLLDGFKELSSQLQGDSQAFTFSFTSELYKNKHTLKRLNSEQLVEFFNSFGL